MKQRNNVTIKLKIADIIIEAKSKFGLERLTEQEQKQRVAERFKNFFYNGREKPHIRIKVEIVDKSPKVHKVKHVFTTRHFQDGSENWHLFKKDNTYIYKSPLKEKKQVILINRTFNRITAYLLPKENKGRVWRIDDIIYDFLQVLLINYFALHKIGVFVHSIGVKDLDGKGLLFAGKSGCGKTTTAKLWYKHSRAMILNDDRIIVRKFNGKFLIYGAPWHGEFNDYLYSKIESAPIRKLLFIYHAPKNIVRRISQKEAFSWLYPALFPTFWDKGCLENVVSFCQALLKNVSCYRLGFVNNKKVIKFVRKIDA